MFNRFKILQIVVCCFYLIGNRYFLKTFYDDPPLGPRCPSPSLDAYEMYRDETELKCFPLCDVKFEAEARESSVSSTF